MRSVRRGLLRGTIAWCALAGLAVLVVVLDLWWPWS